MLNLLARSLFPMRHKEGHHSYLIALGSNQRLQGYSRPQLVLKAAVKALAQKDVRVVASSRIVSSSPIGPSIRTYANAAIIAETKMEPPEFLAQLQAIERDFGRKRMGQCWRARTLDLDLILWSGGSWCAPLLTIPHPLFRGRLFVLGPAEQIAAGWRDPFTGFCIRHLLVRLDRRRPHA